MLLACANHSLDLTHPRVMGIINVTPDSFSGDGLHKDIHKAIQQAKKMVDDGAAILDIGGESTRPGASKVTIEEEYQRTIPLIKALAQEIEIPISIDTSKPEIMQAAVEAGAGLINDVRALQLPGALEVAAAAQVPVCLMHMQNQPHNMQNNPVYDQVVEEVASFLKQRIAACQQAGIVKQNILLDPGIGFGKTLENNLQLLKQLSDIGSLPVVVGVSRKSLIGHLVDASVTERLPGSLALAVLAVERGAKLIRTHDVKATHQALKVAEALLAV